MKLQLKTITPVFIGSNDTKKLSPYSDYVQTDDKIKIIDNDKFSDLLSRDLKLVDNYVENVKEMDKSNTQSIFSLGDFVKNKLKTDVDEILKEEYKVIGNTGKTIISRFTESSGRYFIPGSTLKGAFRTALYYFWLEKDISGKDSLNRFVKELIKIFEEKGKLLEKKNAGTRLDDTEFKRLNYLSKSSNVTKETKNVFDETLLFGRNEESDSKNIRFSDSTFIDKEYFIVLNSSRLNFGNAKDEMPIWNISLYKDVYSEFELNIVGKFNNPFLGKLKTESLNYIYQIINNFSKSLIKYEIENIEEIKDEALINKLSGIKKYYEYLLDIIVKSDNKFCILRLGAGKTYYDNSIGLLFINFAKDNEKNQNLFKIYRDLFEIGKKSKYSFKNDIFPITRSFYNIDGALYPPGWVAIGNKENISNITFDIDRTISEVNESIDTVKPEESKTLIKKNYLKAEIVDSKSVPAKVKILEGEFKDKVTILPKVTLSNLELTEKSIVLVELEKDKKTKKLIKAEYKGKAE